MFDYGHNFLDTRLIKVRARGARRARRSTRAQSATIELRGILSLPPSPKNGPKRLNLTKLRASYLLCHLWVAQPCTSLYNLYEYELVRTGQSILE